MDCKLYDPIPEQFSHDRHLDVTRKPQPGLIDAAAREWSAGPPRSVATPCVKVCIVDGANSLCLGCWRTLSEIGGWSAMNDAERARVMADLPARQAASENRPTALKGSAS